MLDGKVIIVTGGASGIGRATALILARAGARVLVTDYNEAGAAETRAMIVASGGEAKSLKANIANENEVIPMVDFAVASFGRLDGAFNNAGIAMHGKRAEELEEKEWDAVLDVNLKGTFFCMKYETLAMKKTGGGAIVNCSSVNGLVGNPNSVEYIASKHGILGLTRGAACDATATRVRVNAVMPAMIDTPMLAGLTTDPELKAFYDTIMARVTVGRIGKPDDVGFAVKWLLSDEATFINGAAICVDGGYTAR